MGLPINLVAPAVRGAAVAIVAGTGRRGTETRMQTGAVAVDVVVARASPMPGPTALTERGPALWRVAEPGRKGHPFPYVPSAGPFGMRRCPA
ncbi:hypothetical protein Srufu_051500 [Streptomyces libani subsp. rufus]|nr:hypothetical protein Srufu_051500 [Streptomyces libani subsp. rufus]